jgi:AcrR family transcriptional regulator
LASEIARGVLAPGAAGGKATGTRGQILAAASEIIQERGLAGATTRAIAERARCAEGSIYRYFEDKHSLFIEVVRTRFPEFLDLVASLPDRAGKGSVRKNLEEVVAATLVFYRGILPMTAGVCSNRELLEHQRRHFRETKTGPMRIIGTVATYLRREQRLGRVSTRAPAEYLVRLVLGACFFQAYVDMLLEEDGVLGTDRQFARETVRGLMEGLTPGHTPSPPGAAGAIETTQTKAALP